MEHWREVSTEDLEGMYPTLSIIEVVCADNRPDMYFYGITKNQMALEAAQGGIREHYDEEEEAEAWKSIPAPSEIAVCIPFSADVLYYLLRGLTMHGETFAYMSPNEGVRTDEFEDGPGVFRFKLTDADFSQMALSDSESFLDDFLTKFGTKTEASKAPVTRTEPAKAEPKIPAPSANNPIDSFLND
jgi:hypothetical protein